MIDSSNEVNIMTLAYTAKLGLTTWKTSIKNQKIDGLPLETYGIALTRFSLQDNLEMVWFFNKSFLLTNINIKVVLEMFFLALSNTDF